MKPGIVIADCFLEHAEERGSRRGALVFGTWHTDGHAVRYTVGAARERNPRGGGRARGGNRGRNVGRGLSRGTSLSPTCSRAGRDTRLLGCGSLGAGLWWTCEGLDCNVSKEAI